MIQRIQSVYLLCAFLLLGLAASVVYVTPEITFGGFRIVVAAAALIVGLGCIVTIFLFNNRGLQAKLVQSLRLADTLIVLGVLVTTYLSGELSTLAAGGFIPLVGIVVAPLAALVAIHMARVAIGRDIELIRSMDRLR